MSRWRGKSDPTTDEALLLRIVQRDADAFEQLYDRHATAVYSLLLRIVRETATAEELLQETFWQLWQKADQYEGSGAVAAWLYRIARNKALDQLRRQQARPQPAHATTGTLERIEAPRRRGVEEQVNLLLNRQHIQLALEQIPVEQRQCLELAYFEGMSQQQIAEHTQTPLGTIKTRVRMGLSKLEHILRAVGYQGSDPI
jgi:RNA polymerase sigma-70 factor (ECF subfamily)